MATNDGGPAFARARSTEPDRHGSRDIVHPAQRGMSLRDYFAAQALIAIGINYGHDHFGTPSFKEEARRAYEAADAMLAARATEPVKGSDPRD